MEALRIPVLPRGATLDAERPGRTANARALEMLERDPGLISAPAAAWAERLGIPKHNVRNLDAWHMVHDNSAPPQRAPWWDAPTVPDF